MWSAWTARSPWPRRSRACRSSLRELLKAADEVAAALQTHLIEEHGADPERSAPQSPSTNSLKLLRQARERLGQGLRAVQADHIAESDDISLRNR